MPDQNMTSFPSSTNEPFQKSNWLIWTGAILILLLVSAGTYYIGFTVNKNKEAQVQYSPSPFEQPKESTPPMESITPISDPGVTWLAKPEKLSDLALFDAQGYSSEYVSYHKVADLVNGGQLIDAQIQEMGIRTFRFKEDPAGTYYLIVKNSNFTSSDEQYFNKDKYGKGLIQVDYNTVYDALNPPQTLNLQGKTIKTVLYGFDMGQFFDIVMQNSEKSGAENSTYQEIIEKIGSTAYGDVYKDLSWNTNEDAYNSPKIKKINYILKLSDTSIIRYSARKDFLADDGTLVGTFTDGSFSSRKFDLPRNGCGGSTDTLYEDSNLDSNLIQIGTTSSGESLYSPTDINSDLFKIYYEIYKSGRTEDANLLSYEAYAAKKPILIWRDPFDNYLIFLDRDYGSLAECGKPVIYLYPEKTISVSVKVGADVKISEPAYQSGWKVTANPNGSIINQNGKTYGSLYWEGTGNGFYPTIDSGRVVSSKNIKDELQNDLIALGLNKKESTDFMNFWLPRMPDAPYIRLSWLTTKDMDALAPLNVSPRPNTIARVFLDFQGQDSPDTNLAPQQLTSFERKGFTLVEWGGLLIGEK